MSDNEPREYSRSESPEIQVCEGGGRPIVENKFVYLFRPGDSVYLKVPGQPQNQGPYLIAFPSGPGKYTLLNLDRTSARGGEQIDENDLTKSPSN